MLNVQVKVLRNIVGAETAIPAYATPAAAGLDLRACLERPLVLAPNTTELIPTGLAIYIGDPDVAALLLPRSGLGHRHGIVLGNLVGLIDADYQGEVLISCWNRSQCDFTIKPGERVAQLVFVPILRPQFEEVTEFQATSRGAGGFGHTGKN